MNEIRKKHIARLPFARYPNYEITSDDVAVTIPLFHSPVDSGFTEYNENRIKNIHAKGAIWVAMGLINNTDLAANGVGIYFHLEDKIYDIAREIFDTFGVDDKFIRMMTIDDFESDNVGAAQYGKKYMFLEDDLSPSQWLMMDSDAFVCTTGDRFEWYDCLRAFVNPSAMNATPAIYQTDKDYQHWVQMCSHAAGFKLEKHITLIEQEKRALLKLGVPESDMLLGPSNRQRTYTCTQMLVLPTAHPIIDYIKQHWKRCHWDEGMLNVYHLLHGDLSLLPDKLGELPKHQFESEYIDRDKSLDQHGYLAHLLPDNRVEMLRTDEYFDDFEHALLPSGTDSRNLQSPRGALGAGSSDKEQAGAHRYGTFYNDLFDILFLKKNRKLSVLEIGVSAYGGGSLAAWQSLECVTRVVGIDTTEYRGTLNEKSTFHQLDGYSRKTIDFLKEKYPEFDIIIDDGSHKITDQAFFLEHYGELLDANGRLVCEDVADDDFFRQMCQLDGIYGLDLSANRPEKRKNDTHNDRILVKEITIHRRDEVSSSALETEKPRVFTAPPLRERHHLHILMMPYGHRNIIPTCAFDQRVHRSADMWADIGYNVTTYGHKDVVVSCNEHVPITDDAILEQTYGQCDYNFVPDHSINDATFKTFADNAVPALRKRVKKNDLVLAFYGQGHKVICDSISDLPCHIVEPSIGYPDPFSKNRVYQSIGYMHNVRGQATYAYRLQQAFPDKFDEINITPWNVESENTPLWNDTVIPNFYNPDLYIDPEVSDNDREEWLCFIGRIHPCKGLQIVFDMVEAADIPIKVAGPGDINRLGFPVPKQVEYLGIADNELRRYLLTRAKALVVPSLYLEPFLGIHVERLFPACPLITVDFGAPMEYCLDSVTGFRCMNMDDFMYALRNLDQIDKEACRKEALQFTVKRAAISYHEYFNRILRNNSIGWNSYDPNRARKDGLRRDMTASEIEERYAEIQQNIFIEGGEKNESAF
ncbi:hypothetical protein F4054_23810 [Candidatus Poribacteria bacterium]|nr:hypothetical protein [Candidatus Poribacteria bacterium]MYK25280.1 hypothetical protein [Candidatus Poribacteria bacterium]